MKRKTNLILFGTVFAIIGTVYAFSGYGNIHTCKDLLSLGTNCNSCTLIGSFSKSSINNVFNSNNISYYLAMNTTSLIKNLEDKDVSFFNVPLVCSAAPTIGCGSRAKPILSSFEASENVKEAWLNKAGTTIAVVWQDGIGVTAKKEITNSVFSEHSLKATEISTEEYSATFKSFEANEGWLKGSDVDKLSKEEASIFADKIAKTIKDKTDISASHLKKIEQKISEEFYDFFVNYESVKDLENPNSYKSILKEVISYGNNLAGKDVMPSLETLWSSCSNISNTPSCCKGEKSCSPSCKVIG